MQRAALLFVAFASFCAFLYAQGDRGTISGTITDPSGAIVPNVSLTLTNDATNLTYTSASSPSGTYTFVSLPIGNYTLKIEAPGFRRQEMAGIQVQVNQQSRVDVNLQVGDVTQTVEVNALASLVQAESTDVGTVIDNKRFLDLPLTLGGGIRNPSAFIFLSPGVSPGNTWEKHISGGGSFNDQTYFDGIALSRGDLANDGEVNPSVDAIAEFKLVTNNYSAEYTHALSGVTSFTMKSGTNDLHGSAFHFFANDKLDARGFFGATRAPRKQNEWGFTVGAPIVLPKLYNGRDRTFFFFSIDQYYLRGGQLAGFNTLPTARMLQGDFGEWPGPIYDPRTTAIDASGRATRQPFANNVIPRSAFSSVTSKMLPLHPIPELPGIANNSIAPLGSPMADQRTSGFKIDHSIKSNHRLSGMFNYTDRPSIKSPAPSRLLSVGRSTGLENYNFQVVTTRLIRVNYDWTVSPNVLNHIGAGFSRFRNPNFSLSFNDGWVQPDGGKLGLRGLQFDLFPTVMFQTQGYTRYGDHIASDNYFTTLALVDTLTWVKNRHTIKIGGEVQAHRDNYRLFDNGGGSFEFQHLETALPGVANSGNSFASFLLGAVDAGSAYFRESLPGSRYKYYGAFIDDAWKVTSKLTLNMGLRYEVQVPTSDPAGRLSYLDPTVPNPGAGNVRGAYVFGGNGPGRQGWNRLFDIHWKNFAPRFGLAYAFSPRTVFRGGYGIFFQEYTNRGIGQPSIGFSITPRFASPDNGLTPAFYWDSGFPQNFTKPPLISPTVANGLDAQLVDRAGGGTIPYSQQWNIMLERQLSADLMISGAYVANKGTHIYDGHGNVYQLNQLHPSFFSLGEELLRSRIDSPLAQAAGFREPFPEFLGLHGPRATVAQALRPFPQYQNVSVPAAPYANSTYHSFQFKLDKRFARGLASTVAYTFSKHLADNRGFTDQNAGIVRQDHYQREKSYSPTDQPQILTFSFNYSFPFGRSQTTAFNKLVGGWSISGVGAYSSGFPLPISTTNLNSFVGVAGSSFAGVRPNLTGQPIRAPQADDKFDPNRNFFLNRAAFANPRALEFGSAPVYLPVRAPYNIQESFGVFKETRFLAERMTHQFRLELSNPFNRVTFGTPVTNLSNANFGRITSQGNSPRIIQFGMKLIW